MQDTIQYRISWYSKQGDNQRVANTTAEIFYLLKMRFLYLFSVLKFFSQQFEKWLFNKLTLGKDRTVYER